MRRVLSMWLARNGHQVIEARDGVEAQGLITDSTIDLVVTDVNMPRLDGMGFVAWLRSEVSDCLPVIMLSSRCDQTAMLEKMKDFHAKVHPKPFSPSRLVVEIETLLAPQAAG
jgi:DNA-binding response OmpR family regulator